MARAVVAILASMAVSVEGHGAMTQPRTRNAVDGAVSPWNESVPESVPFMFWCAAPDATSTDPRKVSGRHGQACFYFNNGCDISCDEWCAFCPNSCRCSVGLHLMHVGHAGSFV